MYTIEDVKTYVAEFLDDIMAAYAECMEVPDFLRGPRLEEVWKTGCWLRAELLELGASEEDCEDIGFCHGQRSLCGDPWESAVMYVNQYARDNAITDKPGLVLAKELLATQGNGTVPTNGEANND